VSGFAVACFGSQPNPAFERDAACAAPLNSTLGAYPHSWLKIFFVQCAVSGLSCSALLILCIRLRHAVSGFFLVQSFRVFFTVRSVVQAGTGNALFTVQMLLIRKYLFVFNILLCRLGACSAFLY
jgi:hypothetical protein